MGRDPRPFAHPRIVGTATSHEPSVGLRTADSNVAHAVGRAESDGDTLALAEAIDLRPAVANA